MSEDKQKQAVIDFVRWVHYGHPESIVGATEQASLSPQPSYETLLILANELANLIPVDAKPLPAFKKLTTGKAGRKKGNWEAFYHCEFNQEYKNLPRHKDIGGRYTAVAGVMNLSSSAVLNACGRISSRYKTVEGRYKFLCWLSNYLYQKTGVYHSKLQVNPVARTFEVHYDDKESASPELSDEFGDRN